MGKKENILGLSYKLFSSIYSLTNFVVFNPEERIFSQDNSEEKILEWLRKFSSINIKLNPILFPVKRRHLKKLYKFLMDYYSYERDFENTTFYQSIKYVRETDEIILSLHQSVHYLTSYWLPFLTTGQIKFINSDAVYYPPKDIKKLENLIYDKLDIDLSKEMFVLTLKDFIEIFKKQFLYKNRAYTFEQLELIVEILKELNLSVNLVDIKNRELQAHIVKNYSNISLKDISPDFLLRYIVYSLTNKALIVNSKRFRRKLKRAYWNISEKELIRVFRPFISDEQKEMEFISHFKSKAKIWKIIHRKIEGNLTEDKKINKILNLFNKARYDKSIKTFNRKIYDEILENKGDADLLRYIYLSPNMFLQNYLHYYRFYINNGLNINHLYKILENVLYSSNKDLRYVINLYNTLKYRKYFTEQDVLFNIRNGRQFIREEYGLKYVCIDGDFIDNSISLIEKYFVFYLQEKFKKEFDKESDIKIPTTDREIIEAGLYSYSSTLNLTSNIPINFLVGIHWYNNKRGKREERVDLDLSATLLLEDKKTKKIKKEIVSWFSEKKFISDNIEVIFSGDVTDAPRKRNGACEVILVNIKNRRLLKKYNVFIHFDIREYTEYGVEDAQLVLIPISRKHIKRISSSRNMKKYALVNLKNSILNIPFKLDEEIGSINLGLLDINNKRFIFGKKFDGDRVNTEVFSETKQKTFNMGDYVIRDMLLKAETRLNILNWFKFLTLAFDNINLKLKKDFKDEKYSENCIVINFNNFNLERFVNKWV
ncbi:MAG: hypothetical protein DSY60_05880 [Persephonella sp.]|nr:MAG: hypothetical protein DSY60_05880 [Persephonella sp.]